MEDKQNTAESFYEKQVLQNKNKNSIGLIGFIISLIAFLVSWIPMLDILLWFFGALFSIIGLFKTPKKFAITGTILSIVSLIIMNSLFSGLANVVSNLTY